MNNVTDLITDIWMRIERVLITHAPEVRATLLPGASLAELDELEAGLGLSLPADLRRSLEIHNGQNDPSQCLAFCGTMKLLSTRDMLRDWRMLTELGIDFDNENGMHSPGQNSLNSDWWRRSCIPFGHCEGYYTCVDVFPSRGLTEGRIVEHTHDGPMEETNMTGFADWLELVVFALEAGEFDRSEYGFFRVHPQFAWKT